MITLKTLKDASAQEVFDQVAKHLLTQMRISENNESCAYRGHDGLKCAAGCLIADDEYDTAMDENGSGWLVLVDKGVFPDTPHTNLIHSLQAIHDVSYPENWVRLLRKLAAEKGLNTKVIEEYAQDNS